MKRFSLCLLLMALSLSAGCRQEKPSADVVRGTVMRYTQLLVEGYRTLDMNPLQEVATLEHSERVYHHMAALGEAKVRMESQLKGIEFIETSFPREGEAVVKTREVWDFIHKDIKSGEKRHEEKNFTYELTYHLEKIEGRWLITAVAAAEGATKPPGAGRSGK